MIYLCIVFRSLMNKTMKDQERTGTLEFFKTIMRNMESIGDSPGSKANQQKEKKTSVGAEDIIIGTTGKHEHYSCISTALH